MAFFLLTRQTNRYSTYCRVIKFYENTKNQM